MYMYVRVAIHFNILVPSKCCVNNMIYAQAGLLIDAWFMSTNCVFVSIGGEVSTVVQRSGKL